MRLNPIPFVRLSLVFALCVALAGSGFAHRFSAEPAGLAAYLAAGGSYQDICDDDGSSGHSAHQSCDACRLVDGATLPPVMASCIPAFAVLGAAGMLPAEKLHAAFRLDPSRPVRAPPFGLIA